MKTISTEGNPRRKKNHGKANRDGREFPPGHSARRQCTGGRREDHARPQGPQCGDRKEVRRADHHQGRRHRSEGNRAAGPARKHGRADGEGSRFEDFRRGRRRHHHGDRAGTGHLPRRREDGRGRRKPHGAQARHRKGRRSRRRGSEEVPQGREGRHDRASRHDQRQQRQADRLDHRRSDEEGRQGRRHHRRGIEDHGDDARSGRRHAVRPRLSFPLLRHRPGAHGMRAGRRSHPHPRKERSAR